MSTDPMIRGGSLNLPSLPDGWKYKELGDLLQPNGLSYGIVQPGSEEPDGIPILRVKNIRKGRLLTDDVLRVGKDVEANYQRTRLNGGEVLLSLVGSVGEVAVAPPSVAGWNVARAIAVIRAEKSISSSWIQFCLESGMLQHFMGIWQTNTVQATLNLRDVRRLPIVLPPEWERDAIVAVLGALDDKIAVNSCIIATAHELMSARYLGVLDAGAKEVAISDIAVVYDGPHATPKKTENGPWFLSISSLVQGRLKLEESAHLDEADFERWTRRVTPTAGDVLFSYETRLGEAALMPTGVRACLGRRMALLRPQKVGSRTLLQAFLSQSFQETIRQYAVHGATVDRIPLTEFPAWRIELPTDENKRLENVLSGLGELAEQRERENAGLAKLRDTLLPKLMPGEIRVRDAEKVVEDVTL